jgi:hypothetical protein
VVINLELPWNPMRLEQRAGRVDRIGQRRVVHVVHLIARDTWETTVLDRLRSRLSTARVDIDVADPLGISFTEAPPTLQTTGARPGHRPREAADRERARLIRVRSLIGCACGGTSSGYAGGPLVAARRRRGSAAATGTRPLALVRADLADDAGRSSATRVIALQLPAMRPRSAGLGRLAREVVAMLAPAIQRLDPLALDEGFEPWRTASVAAIERFWSVRLARENAIASRRGDVLPRVYQGGLFDRRAARHAAHSVELERRAADDTRRRLAAIRASASVSFQPLALAMLVLPRPDRR